MSKIKRLPRFTLLKKFPLKINGSVCKSCVRSVMLYGSETWCLGHNEVEILQRTERATVRSMCGVKLMYKKSTKDLVQMCPLVWTCIMKRYEQLSEKSIRF